MNKLTSFATTRQEFLNNSTLSSMRQSSDINKKLTNTGFKKVKEEAVDEPIKSVSEECNDLKKKLEACLNPNEINTLYNDSETLLQRNLVFLNKQVNLLSSFFLA